MILFQLVLAALSCEKKNNIPGQYRQGASVHWADNAHHDSENGGENMRLYFTDLQQQLSLTKKSHNGSAGAAGHSW